MKRNVVKVARNLFVCLLLISIVFSQASVFGQITTVEANDISADYFSGQMIVSIKPGASISAASTSYIMSQQVSIMDQKGFKVIDSILSSGQKTSSSNSIEITSLSNEKLETVVSNTGYVYLVEYTDTYGSFENAKLEFASMLTANGISVKYIEPNYKVSALGDVDTSMHDNQKWHYEMINAPKAWTMTTGSNAVKVAVLDTGIDHTHQNLANFVDTTLGATFVGGTTMDVAGHGTHVAGTIASYGTVSGVMKSATLIPVKVLNDYGNGSLFSVEQGIVYATSINADVINMSLGGGPYSESMDDACKAAVENGTVVVAASGNSFASSISYPAAYSSVIAVGAVDSNKKRAAFSNYGSGLDIMAPGVGVYSTTPGNTYDFKNGTSMACPHVSGVVGLIRSVNRNISVENVKSILKKTAQYAGSSNEYGAGIVDAEFAVRAASDQVSVMTSNTSPKGIASSSSDFSSLYEAWKAFDGNNESGSSSRWISDYGMSQWIAYQFSEPKRITEYYILPEIGLSDRAPKSWDFQAWTGSQWITLDSRTNMFTGDDWKSKGLSFSFENNKAYRKYRLYVKQTNGSSVVSIQHFKLYSYIPDQIKVMASNTSPSGVASASSSFGPSYLPWKAFDGDNESGASSRWISGRNMDQWIEYEFTNAKRINEYYVLPELGLLDRSPKTFNLLAWNGYMWVVLDRRSNIGMNEWFNNGLYFQFENNRSYNRYRLHIRETNGSPVVSIQHFKLFSR